MKSIHSFQRQSLFLLGILSVLPMSSLALNDREYSQLLENPQESYVYCDKSRSKLADVMAQISKLDANENSPVWQLNRHIEEGYSVGLQNIVEEALMHAEEVILNASNDNDIHQLNNDLNLVIDQVVAGALAVDVKSAIADEDVNRAFFCCDMPHSKIKVRQKLYVLEEAKFFQDVKFKDDVLFEDDVVIEESLSVAEAVVGCDLTVGCNINMNDSVDATIGNVLKNGSSFIHNFGTANTFVGVNSGNFAMTGTGNTAMGANSLELNAAGISNAAFGLNALAQNTDGNGNTAVGDGALLSNVTGDGNTAVGFNALNVNEVDNNTAVGTSALAANSTGGFNTAVGSFSLISNTIGAANTAVGYNSLEANTTGDSNTALGSLALEDNTIGSDNTAVGSLSLQSNSTGNNNTAVGVAALQSNTTGSDNTAVGESALDNSTGSRNIGIGAAAGSALGAGDDNVYIAHAGAGAESDTTRIGSVQTRCFVAGVRGVATGVADAIAVLIDSSGQLGTVSSSKRFKKDIQNMNDASANIYKLRPVQFIYKNDASETAQFGLIAEEAAEVLPEIVVNDEDGQPFTVQYHVLPALLLNEVQKQYALIQALIKRIDHLESNRN